ncbi:MAG: TIGR03621 family F420-dependent LLM class oxidoreductase [Actinomycetota bacterium]
MNRPFRFGVQCFGFGDPETVRTTARACAEHGYDEFFTADHLGAADPFAPLLVAAAEAPEVRVGPLVINNALHNPVLLARTAATVDRLTDGRLVLGLGTGYAQAEHDAADIDLPPPGPRVAQFAESLQVLRQLLDDGASRLDGDHRRVAVDDLGIRPVQERVPFLIGGHGRRVVGLAARHADIYQFTGLTHGPGGALSPGGFRLADLRLRASWLEDGAGDRLATIERSALAQRTALGPAADAARDELVERWGLTAEDLVDCPFALFGSVEEVVDKLERLRTMLGISHYVVRDAEGFAPVVEALRGR